MSKVAYALAASAALFWAAAGSPAAATVVLDVGPGALQPDEKLLFDNNTVPGLIIEGVTNETGTAVTVEGGEDLIAGSPARLDTLDGKINTPFTFHGFANQLVGFDLTDGGLAFTETSFRILGGTATELTLTFVDTAGDVFQQTFGIPANGFFNARTLDGQLIDYFSLAANGSIGDVRHIRIGGVTGVVPEPATWAMMLLGFGAAGAMLRTRRRPSFI